MLDLPSLRHASGKVSPDLLKAAHIEIPDPIIRGFSHISSVKMPRRKVL